MAKSAKGTIRQKDTEGTGWEFTGAVDSKVGFCLEDISHDGHFFADSIRIERIAVAGFSDRDAKRARNVSNIHVFGLGDCKEVTAPQLVPLAAGSTDPLGYYSPRVKAVAKYQMANLLRESDQTLEAEIAFLFTPYNKDPSHEPGGIIPAARIYPTLTFKVPGISHKKQKATYRRATAVQVLFRLHIRLDDRGIGNQVGVFTDLEDIGPMGGAESAAATGFKPGSTTFLAAEKPTPFEIVGRGIDHGAMGGWGGILQGWDNIHQYSHPALPGSDPNDGIGDQPFTPGLPYGGHIHWRWGATATTGVTGVKGGPQFGGAQGPGTPLIDDNVRNQNLEFAIVDLAGWFGQQESDFLTKVDFSADSFLFKDFSDIFQNMRHQPDLLMPSANIVIWMSITAWGPGWDLGNLGYREFFPASGVSPEDFPNVPHDVTFVLDEWGGTLFPQGIFFPHEDETYFRGSWGKRVVRLVPGIKKAQYLPKAPKRTWRR